MIKAPRSHEASHETFLAHLQARLGFEDEAAAVSKLGDWLASYQPGPAALARAMSLSPSQQEAA